MKKTGILFLSIITYAGVAGQSLTVQQYIDRYKELAVQEMRRTGVPASVTLAQGILETENGNSDLVLRSKNHFGIKCKSNWTGSSVYHNDDEEGECFRKYESAEESFRDHSDFLRKGQRYAFLFSLDIKDYKGWAYGLKKAGYATNPRYPYILINSIEKYNLHQYTLQGLSANDGVFDGGKYKDDKEKEQTASIVPVRIDDQSPESPASAIKSKKTLYSGLKAVFATRETSLLAIATENNIALSKLLEYNDLMTDGLLAEDQWIFLEKKPKQGNNDIYVTKEGETLYKVSQAAAVQLENLEEYNRMKGDLPLAAGTKVMLRPGLEIEASAPVAAKKVHEVLPKEGLYAISKKYNVSVKEIREWNKLATDNLYVGQQLVILK